MEPVPHHILLQPGRATLPDLYKEIERGIIIYNTMGAWAGNPYSGNVSGTASLGIKIENGEVVGRIKDCMFSLNAFDYFRNNLIDLTQETKSIDSFFGYSTSPYLALDEVIISTNA